MFEFIGDFHAIHAGQTCLANAESWRKTEPRSTGDLVSQERCDVMRGVAEGQRPAISQAAIGLSAQDESICTKSARSRGAWPDRASRSNGVAEFPGRMTEILFEDKVLGNVPGVDIRRQDQLELSLVLMTAAADVIWRDQIILVVVAHDL